MSSWIIIVEWLSRLILLLLIVLSIWSISIILERRKFYTRFETQDQNPDLKNWIFAGDRAKLMHWASTHNGLRAGTVSSVLARNSHEQMEASVLSYWGNERIKLEKNISVLGTLGSTTPFVGLLGTILGIVVAFGTLSSGQMDAQKTMLALAEALIATAVGLMVAIPAVVAFNYFSRKLSVLQRECESIKNLLIAYFSVGA